MDISKYRVDSGKGFDLADYDAGDSGDYDGKKDAAEDTEKNIREMMELQDKLYAHDRYALLLILQAMDAAGKDSTIKHVMGGFNPQGTQVYSFKVPSVEEMDHDYLWRNNKSLPERGRIGIFNRSYYEEVLVVRVHDLVQTSHLPRELVNEDIWETRYRQIRDYERYLLENGTVPIKLFLHVSKEEQKKRFLERIDDPAKNWKFSAADVRERGLWKEYENAYTEAIKNTSTKDAPWYVIPADKKWFTRLLVSEVILDRMKKIKPCVSRAGFGTTEIPFRGQSPAHQRKITSVQAS